MPRPTSGTTIQRPDLGVLVYEYVMNAAEQGFICLDLLPIFDAIEQSADYPVIPFEALLKLQSTSRAPRGAYARGDYEFETGTYACKENGWEEPVDDVERKLYRRFFDAEVVAALRAADIVLRSQEARVAAKVFNTSNITQTGAVTTEWDVAATCTPREDVAGAKEAMRAAGQPEPNVLAISKKVFNKLLLAKQVTDAFRYGAVPFENQPSAVKKTMLAAFFDVERILVGGAIKDTTKKGKAFSAGDIWDDEYAGLFRVSKGGQDLREPCLGRTFLWTADSPQNIVTESYRDETIRSDIYRVRQYTDEAFVFTGAGYLLSNIHT
jgi:hypothetical protein